MFPQISKKKKKQFVFDEIMAKEWEQIAKELQSKSKLVIKKIPINLINDLNKVSRLKSVPEFYTQYVLLHSQKKTQSDINLIFTQQIEMLMSNKSYYHLISKTLKKRQDLIASTKQSLMIVEGFILMNSGKNIPINIKPSVEQIVKDCQSLQKLKELQKKQAQLLAENIIKLRKNTRKLIQAVQVWRKALIKDHINVNTFLSNLPRYIFPQHNVNCLLLPFYDTLFIKQSHLKSEFIFKDHDPFFLKISKNKKRSSQFQNYILDSLKTDVQTYTTEHDLLMAEIPRTKQEEQIKIRKEKERQIMRERQKEKQKQKQKLLASFKVKKQQSSSNMKLRKSISQRKMRKTNQNEFKNSSRSKEIMGRYGTSRSKSIINIDKLISSKKDYKKLEEIEQSRLTEKKSIKSPSKQPSKQPTNKRIVQIYKIQSKKRKSQAYHNKQKSIEDFKNEKNNLEKELKAEKQQKSKIKKILSKSEIKSISSTKQYQKKMQYYQQEINRLKQQMQERRKNQRSDQGNYQTEKHQNKQKEINQLYKRNYVSKVSLIDNSKDFEKDQKLKQKEKNNKNLDAQIQLIMKEKIKLEKQLNKQAQKANKDTDINQKKVFKYEQVINNLQEQLQKNRQLVKDMQQQKKQNEKKKLQHLGMYVNPKKQFQFQINKQKRQSNKKNQENSRPSLQNNLKISSISKKKQNNKSLSRLQKDNQKKDVEIIKTKQTIEIVFKSRSKERKNKNKNKNIVESEYKLHQLEKEKKLLEKKLQNSSVVQVENPHLYEHKLRQKDQKLNMFEKELERQKNKQYGYQEKMNSLRKNINQEFEIKLNQERTKFQKEKQSLLVQIQQEKQEKMQKDKHLFEQYQIFKQMESKQNELIDILQKQKKQRKQRQQQLEEEIQKKQQLRYMIQVEQIKKLVEGELRKELEQNQSQQESQNLQYKKLKLEEEMKQMQEEKDLEMEQMDDQNEKLKQLISKIKNEETKLLEVMQQNVEDYEVEEDQQRETIYNQEWLQKSKDIEEQEQNGEEKEKVVQDQQNKFQTLEEVQQELKFKSEVQLMKQSKLKEQYSQIKNSKLFQQKQKIENIVQFYLSNPHQYPKTTQQTLEPAQKKKIVEKIQQRNKQADQFQKELFNQRNLSKDIPNLQKDQVTNHFQNLRQVYQDYEVQSLRRQLFPPLKEDQVYNDRELSVQSQEPPIITIMDDVKQHEKKYDHTKKKFQKNFLAINRLKVMLLEQNRREKERILVEEQSKRKKIKIMLPIERNKGKEEQKKQDLEKQQQKEIQKDQTIHNKSKISIQSRKSIKSNKKSQKVISDNESQKSVNLLSESQKQPKEKENQKKIINTIQEQKKQQSPSEVSYSQLGFEEMEQQQNEQEKLFNEEKEILRQDISSYQSQLRSFISGEQRFQVYQQFVNEQEFTNFSRYIFEKDEYTNNIQYLFSLNKIQDEPTLLYFAEFENRCKRLGQVYVKQKSIKQRKYILRRNLFEQSDKEFSKQGEGIRIGVELTVFGEHLRQIKYGFNNLSHVNHTSLNAILAYYSSRNRQFLSNFRQKVEKDLKYRQLLLTSLLFQKKQLQIKPIQQQRLQKVQILEHLVKLQNNFDIYNVEEGADRSYFLLEEKLTQNQTIKRCILEVEDPITERQTQANYLILNPKQPLTKIQSSNSSEVGYFLNLIPKYKMMIIEAEQFLNMSQKNQDLTAFFYVKHFIKNISQVQKETFQRVYLPEICQDEQTYYDQLSKLVKNSIFLKQNVRLGWKNPLSNSIIFTPTHKDLVIQKPFIMAILSGNVQRAVQGTPLFVKMFK